MRPCQCWILLPDFHSKFCRKETRRILLLTEANRISSRLCLNIMDAPMHVNFSNEMISALGLADRVMLVVDAAEVGMVIHWPIALYIR